MRSHRRDLTTFGPPRPMALRDAFELALLATESESPALARQFESLAFDARITGVSTTAFEAALADFLAAHDAEGPYPLERPVLRRLTAAAMRGYYSD